MPLIPLFHDYLCFVLRIYSECDKSSRGFYIEDEAQGPDVTSYLYRVFTELWEYVCFYIFYVW